MVFNFGILYKITEEEYALCVLYNNYGRKMLFTDMFQLRKYLEERARFVCYIIIMEEEHSLCRYVLDMYSCTTAIRQGI